jgi:hypothetical protein
MFDGSVPALDRRTVTNFSRPSHSRRDFSRSFWSSHLRELDDSVGNQLHEAKWWNCLRVFFRSALPTASGLDWTWKFGVVVGCNIGTIDWDCAKKVFET